MKNPSDPRNIWLWSQSPYTECLHFLPLETALAEAELAVDRETARTWGEYVGKCDPLYLFELNDIS